MATNAPTPYQPIKATHMDPVKKFGLRDYGDLTPVLPQDLIKSWVGQNKTPNHPAKKAQYLPPVETLPNDYASRIIRVTDNAIGKDAAGNLLFIYLKTVEGKPAISERVQKKALTGCRGMEFKSCDDSNRRLWTGFAGSPGYTGDGRLMTLCGS